MQKPYFSFSWVMGGFQKSYIIFGGGMSKYLLFLKGRVGGPEKAQNTLT